MGARDVAGSVDGGGEAAVLARHSPYRTEEVAVGGELRLNAFHPCIVVKGDVLVEENEDIVQLMPVRLQLTVEGLGARVIPVSRVVY